MVIGIKTKGLKGEPVVIKINGLEFSVNSKTGNMIQTYILPESWIHNKWIGSDKPVCGNCIHAQHKNADCYVRKGWSLVGLHSTIKGAIHLWKTPESFMEIIPIFSGKGFRFGTYGEAVLMGETIVKAICAVVKNWSGYTHQWRKRRYDWAAGYFMASVESVDEKLQANALGYRTYRVMNKGESMEPDEKLCPASKEAGRTTACLFCNLCRGNSVDEKNIAIYKH